MWGFNISDKLLSVGMKRLLKNKKRTFVYLLTGLTLLFVLFFTATSFIIGRDVKRLCLEAKRDYSGVV